MSYLALPMGAQWIPIGRVWQVYLGLPIGDRLEAPGIDHFGRLRPMRVRDDARPKGRGTTSHPASQGSSDSVLHEPTSVNRRGEDDRARPCLCFTPSGVNQSITIDHVRLLRLEAWDPRTPFPPCLPRSWPSKEKSTQQAKGLKKVMRSSENIASVDSFG